MPSRLRLGLLVPLLALLAACASNDGVRNLYYWGNFPDANYSWLKDEVQDAQDMVDALEKDAQKAVANKHDLPPGFHAHLGMLYLRLGQANRAMQHWQAEKAAFPESAPFMDLHLQALQNSMQETNQTPAVTQRPRP